MRATIASTEVNKMRVEAEQGHANLIMRNEHAADFAKFVSATFGSPPDSSLINAVGKGWLGNFPRVTAKMIRDNPPNSVASAKGHLDLTRQGQHSTKTNERSLPKPALPVDDDDFSSPNFSDALELDENTHDIYARVMAASDVLSSDLSGRFPVTSHNGFSYILFSLWRGYVHYELMRNKSASEYVRAFGATLEFFRNRGARPRVQRMDNETSKPLQHFFRTVAKVDVEYVPPQTHRANKAERAIRDGKNHLISVLCSTDPAFPADHFDELIWQAELTLNHLRPCRHRPNMSAWEGLHGKKYDFRAHPIAPCGTAVLIFETPGTRGTFAPHGVKGFYLSAAEATYRSFRCLVTETNAIRVSDTLAWFPLPYRMPGSSAIEQLHAVIKDFNDIMLSISTSDHIQAASQQPFTEHAATATSALRELAALYSPPGLDATSGFGTTYPTRRAHTPHQHPGGIERVRSTVDPSQPPPPPPATLQRVPEDYTDPPFPTAPPSLTQVVVARHTEAAPHADMPNSPIHAPPMTKTPTVPQQVLKKSSAQCDRVTRQSAKRISPGAAFSAIAAAAQRTIPAQHSKKRKTRRKRDVRPAVLDQREQTEAEGMSPHERQQENMPRATTPMDLKQTWRSQAAALSATATQAHGTRQLARQLEQDPQRPPDTPNGRGWALNLDQSGNPLKFTAALKGPNAAHWNKAQCEELIRLVRTTETMHAILWDDIPEDRRNDITYYNPQTREKMGTNDTVIYRVRGAAGGDKINYDGPTSAQTADMVAVKILLNSVVSDKAQWASADIKDFYLGTPLDRPEYMRMQLRFLPDEVLDELNLRQFISRECVLFEITKGMYGLPQAGRIAQERLIGHLAKHGYEQSPLVPCIFRHATRTTAFSLTVDDFGIKFRKREDLEHFIAIMEELYELKVDWTGGQYLGIAIQFSDDRNAVSLSIPGYIAKAIERFSPNLKKGSRSPAVYVPPKLGAQAQIIEADNDDGPVLPASDIKLLQEIIGVLLYYARAIDVTMLTAVNHISSEQARPTQRVMDNAMRVLAYAAAYPNNELVFTACDMVLFCQSDCSFLSRSEARSVGGGIEYLGNRGQPTHINGAIHAFSSIIPVVVASVAEGEYGAAYMTAQHATGSRQVLEFLGYPQPPTLILGDNECAVGLANGTLKIKRSKSINMQFHWLRDRIRQGHFEYQWRKGANNLADFFTKALPVHKHQELMKFLVHTPQRSALTRR